MAEIPRHPRVPPLARAVSLGLAVALVGCQSAGETGARDASAPPDATTGRDAGPCVTSADCPPSAPVCDPDAGTCESACVAGYCTPDKHCDETSGACVEGCSADDGCPVASDAGVVRCDVDAHACVECLANADCAPGLLCFASICILGCVADHPCPLGSLCCAGACVDPASDETCGACDVSCASESDGGSVHCVEGACAVTGCDPGRADCDGVAADGCEVSLGTNPLHCGACDVACDAGAGVAACTAGACGVASCDAPFADCNDAGSCNTNTQTSVLACGNCGKPCTGGEACLSGSCGTSPCPGALRHCSANASAHCESDTSKDPSNCGGCGIVCALPNATPLCAMGACAIASCNAGFADCDHDPQNGCEIDLGADPNNCGACASTCETGLCGTTIVASMAAPPSPSLWTVQGAAFYDASTASFVLTPTVSASGTLIYDDAFTLDAGDSFTFAFDLRIGGGLGGADGLSWVFETDGPKSPGGIPGGGALGMTNFDGYGVEFDTFSNGLCDNDSANHVAVDSLPGRSCPDNGAGPLPVELVADDSLPFALRNSGWHTAVISFEDGVVGVTLDGFGVISGFALQGWTAGTAYYVGFTAAGGASGDRHEVRNVQMTFPTPRCL